MSDECTPTDAEARAWFACGVDDAYSLTADPAMADGNALFDRWLEAHDRRLIAKAVAYPGKEPRVTDALIHEREPGDIAVDWTEHGLDLTWTMDTLRIRTRGREIPAELVRVDPDGSRYTLAWWRREPGGYRFESIGDRLFQDVEPSEAAAVWRQFRIAQTVLDLYAAGEAKEG